MASKNIGGEEMRSKLLISTMNEANENEEFIEQTIWFDGCVLIEIGSADIWMKIYNGQIIDIQDTIPPLGYDFKISGDRPAWDLYFNDDRKLGDLLRTGGKYFEKEIYIEGNLMVANRMHEMIHILAALLKKVIKNV